MARPTVRMVRGAVGRSAPAAMATAAAESLRPIRIVIVGAGYAGLSTARRLRSRLRPGEASITVVDPRSYMTYNSFLPEAASGSIEPRHVVVPLRLVLRGCEVVTAEATAVDVERRLVFARVFDGHVEELSYDLLVVAPGSVTRALPVPGLDRDGIGFTSLGEAIYLRNHVLTQLDKAASTKHQALRRRLLTFVFVGGGYSGVEALGGLEEMARFAASRYYASVDVEDMRWVLVEAMGRIMPEVSRSLAEYAVEVLRARGVEVALETMVKSMDGGHIVLSDGTEFEAGTVVWTAGVKPHPMLADTGLPLDPKGKVRCRATLQVEGQPRVFAAGDCAAIPDLSSDQEGAVCPPTAQHAVRQGKKLADNLRAMIRGAHVTDYRYAPIGTVASFGLHDGVAEVFGVKLKGWPAWALHRAYHVSQMPTVNRKVRILADWAMEVPFPRQIVALGELHQPRAEFAEATRP